MTEPGDSADQEERGQQWVDEFLSQRVNQAREQYDKAINRLWLGNAGGVTLCVTHLDHLKQITWGRLGPIAFFLLGLLALSIGVIADLNRMRRVIIVNEGVNSLLSMVSGMTQRPHERAWSKLNHRTSLFAISFFMVGCFWEIFVFI